MENIIKRGYIFVIKIAVWILSIVSPFVIAPPVLLPDHEDLWINLCKFFVAAFVGLMLMPMVKLNKRKDAKLWWKTSAVLFVLGITLTFYYLLIIRKSTILYETGANKKERIVIGNTLTPRAKKYKQEYSLEHNGEELGFSKLIEDFAPQTVEEFSKIWTKTSLDRNMELIAGSHLLTLFIVSALMLSIGQTLQCLNIKTDEP